jgi:dihydrofolate reductase
MAEFFPTSDDPYAAPMKDIPKVVFASTLERADWPDSRIARGDLAEEIAELIREPGKDIIASGGAAFAQSLATLGLIDRLVLQPVALRHRRELFKDHTTPLRLELVDAQTYDTGATLHIYHPAPAAPSGGPTLAARQSRRVARARLPHKAARRHQRKPGPALSCSPHTRYDVWATQHAESVRTEPPSREHLTAACANGRCPSRRVRRAARTAHPGPGCECSNGDDGPLTRMKSTRPCGSGL